MKFRYCSDLHLEFLYGDVNYISPKDSEETKRQVLYDYAQQILPPQEADNSTVLLLAGDICDNFRAHTRFKGFFQAVSERFSEVIWIPGNHEYYKHKFSDYYDCRVAVNMANEFSNVFYWNRNRTSYTAGDKSVHVIVATLWSDCNRNDPLATLAVGQRLNDYQCITFVDKDLDIYRSLRVSDTIAAHCIDRDYIIAQVKKFKAQDPNCVVIVMTHHAPSYLSIPERYKTDILSHAYASNINWNEFGDHLPNLWIHGHLHDSVDYTIGGMRVTSNPYGYFGHHLNDQYNPLSCYDTEDESDEL